MAPALPTVSIVPVRVENSFGRNQFARILMHGIQTTATPTPIRKRPKTIMPKVCARPNRAVPIAAITKKVPTENLGPR